MRGTGGYKGGRVEVEIPGCGTMVLPDTYEPEKFERPETKTIIDPETLDPGEKVQRWQPKTNCTSYDSKR